MAASSKVFLCLALAALVAMVASYPTPNDSDEDDSVEQVVYRSDLNCADGRCVQLQVQRQGCPANSTRNKKGVCKCNNGFVELVNVGAMICYPNVVIAPKPAAD